MDGPLGYSYEQNFSPTFNISFTNNFRSHFSSCLKRISVLGPYFLNNKWLIEQISCNRPNYHSRRVCLVLSLNMYPRSDHLRVGRFMDKSTPYPSVLSLPQQFFKWHLSPFFHVVNPLHLRSLLFLTPGNVPRMISFSGHLQAYRKRSYRTRPAFNLR